MTSWVDVINYVRTRYEVLEETDSWLRFRLPTDGDRTQQIAVHHVPDVEGAAWLEISSPVGWAKSIDLDRLLELAGTSIIGGAAIVDGVALLKHSVPMADLDILAEFEHPLRLIAARADTFEHNLTNTDHF